MGNPTLAQFLGNASANKIVNVARNDWSAGLLQTESRIVRILRVTAILLADDDGSRATGRKQGSKVTVTEGLLRDPAIHTKSGQNYIDDWISLANKQLFVSGANFLLDRANVRYVAETNTAVNSTVCGVANEQDAVDFIAKKQQARGDNPYREDRKSTRLNSSHVSES